MTRDLDQAQHHDLQRLARVGERGLRLGDEIDAGRALLFGIYGWVSITNTKSPPQSAIITVTGRAFALRSAA